MTPDHRTRVALVGAGEDALDLVVRLLTDQRVDLVAVLDPLPAAARDRIERYLADHDPELVERFQPTLTDDPERIAREEMVDVIVNAASADAGDLAPRLQRALGPQQVQMVSALSARMVWGPRPLAEPDTVPLPSAAPDRRRLLMSLQEIIQAQNLVGGDEDLLSLILDTAIRSTGADRGSLMLLDRADNLLKVRVAQGIEEELISKIRFPLGEGIAGKVAKEGTPILISGRADPTQYRLLRDRPDVQSALSVPLEVEGNVIGVLNVSSSHEEKELTQADLAFVVELAGLDAQIILRSEEMRELRESVAKLKVARQVSQALATPLGLDERLVRVCRLICDLVPGAICAIHVADDTGVLRLRASAPEGARTSEGVRLAQGVGIEDWVYREQEPVVLRDQAPGRGRQDAPRKAYAVVPLAAGDRSLGVMAVQVVSPEGLPPAGEALIRDGAAPIAEAIAAALKEESITRYATQVGAINETGLRLLATQEMDSLVKIATSSAAMILQCDACILRLRDPANGRYTIRSYFGSADVRLQKGLFALDKKFVIQLLGRKQPMLTTDVSQDAELSPESSSARTALGVPLRHPNGTVGTLTAYDKLVPTSFYPVPFTPEDRDVLVRLAAYVERAILQVLFHERARRESQFDDETGLPNRVFLDRRLHDELARAQRHSRRIAIMTCRIANHPEFVERMGEEAGRRLIVKVSEIIRDNLRGFDVVARTEDLTFGILFPEPGARALETITRLTHSINDAVQADLPHDSPIQVQLHYGYAFFPEDGNSPEEVWERASVVRIRTQ